MDMLEVLHRLEIRSIYDVKFKIEFLTILIENTSDLKVVMLDEDFCDYIFVLRPKTCVARGVARKEEGWWEDERNDSIWFWDPNGRLSLL